MGNDRLDGMLAESFKKHKEKSAIIAPDFQCTYEELNRRSSEISTILLQRGLQRNEPVIVVTENKPENLIAIVAVLLSQGVVVPLDKNTPADTVDAILSMTKARFIVGKPTHLQDKAFVLNEEEYLIQSKSVHRPENFDHLSGAALIVFTSGTTGAPKGVVVSHVGYSKKLERVHSLIPFEADDIVLIALKLTFSFGQWTSLISLWRGSTILIVPKFSADEIVGFVEKYNVTKFPIVPSMMRMMLQNTSQDILSHAPVLYMAGGEVLPETTGKAFLQKFPKSDLCDIYGSTETNSADFILMPGAYDTGSDSIGKPTPGVQYKIVKSDGSFAEAGESGELQIKTDHIMMFYLGRPDLTSAAFNGDYFKTGDLAFLRPDGYVSISGRLKDEIHRGGNKIAPAEVEGVYLKFPSIRLAACIAIKDEIYGEKTMLAFEGTEDVSDQELSSFGLKYLAKYKIPDVFKKVDSIPLGRTGKLDRAALRAKYYNG